MKNLLLGLSLLGSTIGASYAQAPIKAGTVQLGGGINYSSGTTDFQSSGLQPSGSPYYGGTFQLSPSMGYFVADNLSLSLGLMMQRRNGNNYLSVGPSLQKYKMLTDQFGFTGTLSAGYVRINQPSSNIGRDVAYNGFYATLTPGIIFLPIPKLGLGASVGNLSYNYLSGSATSVIGRFDTTQSGFTAGFGLNQLTFSGTYFFGR